MKIEVFGTGCPKCNMLEVNATKALRNLGVQAEVVKVTDIEQIVDRGLMSTPALAIDGEVVVAGRVASVGELTELISSRRERA
ncbi:MAG: TM0996/MTH895 family glutaredoxin-like protein [Methanobacteriota archaeon]|nr:MAG: TM0996/MTH895 family glutaredoxin-like protein [Euryarchaeota archaeon]